MRNISEMIYFVFSWTINFNWVFSMPVIIEIFGRLVTAFLCFSTLCLKCFFYIRWRQTHWEDWSHHLSRWRWYTSLCIYTFSGNIVFTEYNSLYCIMHMWSAGFHQLFQVELDASWFFKNVWRIIWAELLWSPYVIGQTIIFSSCFFYLSFFLLLFFPRLISAVGNWMLTILRHMVWP